MIPFLKLIRYKNLLMVLLTMVLTKYALIQIQLNLSTTEFITLVLSVIFITAGGYIINDFYDIETDKVNKPNKVFIGNTISERNSLISYFTITFFGLLLGLYVSIEANLYNHFSIFIGAALLLFLYSKYLKKLPLIGNICTSFLIGLSIYIVSLFDVPEGGTYVLSNHLEYFRSDILFYAKFAFFTTLIREMIKDIEDIDGDYKAGMKTLPILIGRKRTRNVVIVITAIVFVFFIRVIYYELLYNSGVFNYSFIFLLALFIYFFYKLWEAKTKKEFRYLSNLMKIMMLSGILSMIFH